MDDLISRQDAICAIAKKTIYTAETIKSRCKARLVDENGRLGGLKDAIEAVEDVPQKTGKWIECSASEHWKCSECGCRASYWFNEENSSSYDLDMSEWLSNFCPNCGARMECEEK